MGNIHPKKIHLIYLHQMLRMEKMEYARAAPDRFRVDKAVTMKMPIEGVRSQGDTDRNKDLLRSCGWRQSRAKVPGKDCCYYLKI